MHRHARTLLKKTAQAPSRQAYLIQIFPSKECLIATHRLEDSRKSVGLLNLLPGFAAAISLQGVIDNMVIVWVFACQNAGSAGAAQCTRHILGNNMKEHGASVNIGDISDNHY